MHARTHDVAGRIYVRKGLKDFSAIAFYVVSSPKPKLNATKKP